MSASLEIASLSAAALEAGELEPDRYGSVLSVSKQGFHRVAYVEWGDPHASRVAICLHGLSRQGRDFDAVAATLARAGWRVICPDLPGRGRSDWLSDPDEYTLPQYVVDMTVLLARIGGGPVDWIGTSLGGLVGMIIAGQTHSPVQRLVVNDIGPFLPWQALHRLASSVRNMPSIFPDFEAGIAFYRERLAPFGPLTDAQWRHIARHNLQPLENGTFRRLTDPDITASFKPGWFFNLSLWTYWDTISCPTLVLRGEKSDLLLQSTAAEMGRRGPRADLASIPDCGHAPALMSADQIEIIADWLGA